MSRPIKEIPTTRELAALHFLYQHGSAVPREYHEGAGLKAKGKAYTTAMSVLLQMHGKGLLTRQADGRAFRYSPAVSAVELRRLCVHYALAHVFKGDISAFQATIASMGEPARITVRRVGPKP